MIDEAFGAQLRAVRESRGLTRDELAERLGAGDGEHVWRYESGHRDPKLSMVRRFASALEVPIAQLVRDDESR